MKFIDTEDYIQFRNGFLDGKRQYESDRSLSFYSTIQIPDCDILDFYSSGFSDGYNYASISRESNLENTEDSKLDPIIQASYMEHLISYNQIDDQKKSVVFMV